MYTPVCSTAIADHSAYLSPYTYLCIVDYFILFRFKGLVLLHWLLNVILNEVFFTDLTWQNNHHDLLRYHNKYFSKLSDI